MRTLYRAGWVLTRLIGATYLPCTYHNAERVPNSGPAILAANHESFIDPPLVGGGLSRDLHYLGRESLFSVPIMGRLLQHVNVVPVDRDGGGAAGLRAILSRLLDGGAILLFPEGTRTPDGRIHPARSGIGLTVLKSAAPVIPVRIFGTYQTWGRHYTLPRPGRIAVKYGSPMDFADLRQEAKTCSKPRLKDIYRQVADDIMSAIQGLERFTDRDRFP